MTVGEARGAIQVHPPVGEFVNFDVDTTYVIPFTVRNTTREMCTVRFTPPSNQRVFRIGPVSVRLAPGLTHVIEVNFLTHTSQDYKDSFVVFTNKESITVPLIAKCIPDLEFPSCVDFGLVERNRQGPSKLLRFTNRGRRDVRVLVTAPRDAPGVVVNPPECTVPALGTADAYVELTALEVGRHRYQLLAIVDGESATRTVTVTVDVADCKGTLLDPRTGEELHSLSFAKTYAGTRHAIEVDVRNDSDQLVSFAIHLTGESLPMKAPPFSFSPSHGRLGPRETARVTALFAPPALPTPSGWLCRRAEQHAIDATHEGLFSALFVETAHTHNLRVTGVSTTSVGWLSHPVVDFGECGMHDHRDVVITVHNGHEDAPLSFAFPRVAHFRFTPATGTVAPSAQCDVRLTFHPRRLGEFNERFPVVFNETQRHELALSGVAVDIAQAPRLVGGPDKLPEDFIFPLRPAVPTTTERAPGKRRCIGCSAPGTAATFTSTGRWSCRVNGTGSGTEGMRDTDTTPTAASIAAAAPMGIADLGMVPAEGLSPPGPPLPPPALKMKSRGSAHAAEHFSPVTLDAKMLIKKVFKEAPTNPNERRDCRRELQPMDLLRITALTKVLNYGRVTVGSASTKTFYLYNGTSASVLAEMPTEEAHLTFLPQSQVIPPGRAAAFDVRFFSSAVQSYQQVVQLTINGRHMSRFSLQADVVPVEVLLSQDEVVLHFTDFSVEPVARTVVSLFNSGNSDAVYEWDLPSAVPFTIDPPCGTIPSMSRVTALVSFSPPQSVLSAETQAQLRVTGATVIKSFTLKGVVPPTTCVWAGGHNTSVSVAGGGGGGGGSKGKSRSGGVTGVVPVATAGPEHCVDLPCVPAGVPTAVTVVLQNRGRNCAFFAIDPPPPEWLRMIPASGRVSPGETEEIAFVVHHDEPGKLSAQVAVAVRGMRRPLRVSLTVTVSAAALAVLSPERHNGEIPLPFGAVFVGTERVLSVRLANSSDVAGVVVIDLRQHPAHAVRCADDTETAWRGAGEPVAGITHVTIPARKEVTLRFVYCPNAAGECERFLVAWELMGAGETDQLPPLAISGSALASRVEIRRKRIDFPRTIVGATATPHSIAIENTSDEPVSWELIRARGADDTDDVDCNYRGHEANEQSSPFRMDIMWGMLAARATQSVHVTFVPWAVGNCTERYVVYVDSDRCCPCAELLISGFAIRPRIVCDRAELIFPAVPLGVAVEETITIINDGFDAIEVRYNDTDAGPLTVSFPRGAVACAAMARVPVRVEFQSARPLTFASSITFTSDRGETLTLPVTGSAINSFLTTAPYVSALLRGRARISGGDSDSGDSDSGGSADGTRVSVPKPFLLRGDGGLTRRLSLGSLGSAVLGAGGVGVGGGVDGPFAAVDALSTVLFTGGALEALRQWLNQNVFREPVDDVVAVLQETGGRALLDAVRRIAGKWPKRSGNAAPRELCRAYAALDTLTECIRKAGGCLGDVRVPYLMPYDEYCRWQEAGKAQRALTRREFDARARHAWITVVLQLVRVFVLSRVNVPVVVRQYPAARALLPAASWDSAAVAAALVGSNVYSHAESVVWRWLARNHRQCISEGILRGTCRSAAKCVECIHDSVAHLASILLYVPSVATKLVLERVATDTTATAQELEINASILIEALAYIGIPLCASPLDLVGYTAVDWLLLGVTLFLHLPRFLPSAVVVMEGKLLAPITRFVDVVNTSTTTRSYTIEMSNPAFSTKQRDLSIGPCSTAQVEVEITLRFSRCVVGECILIDCTPGALVDERVPIVFRLNAVPNTDSLRVIQMTTPLYSPLSQDILVECPFPQDCVATLRISQDYKDTGTYPESDFYKEILSAFCTPVGVVPLRVGEPTKVPVQFAPNARGRYEARFTFHDEVQGEFSYLIVGTCLPPKPAEKILVRAEAGEEVTHTLVVRRQNVVFERITRALEESRRLAGLRSPRAGGGLLPDMSDAKYSVLFVNEQLEGPNPFFRAPETLTFDDGESSKVLTFTFEPKAMGEYNGLIILASQYDVRCIQLLGKCVPMGERGVIRFACPARQTILQLVPILNTGTETWLVTATLEGSPSFVGPKEFRVPRGKQRDYPLRFSPAWVSADKGTLTLYNNDTGERRAYTLIGESEEPLSEGTIVVECRARERRTEVLKVPDINGVDTLYKVETDIPFSSGEKSLLVRRSMTGRYTLVLQPTMSGTYSGTVICRAPNGRYVWYAVTVRVSPPEREGVVDIRTDVRSPVTADVSIKNPTDQTITFAVQRTGDGLFGDNTVLVDAGSPAIYSFLFVPTTIGTFSGRLAFCNEAVGEFWYELRLVVEEAAPEVITFQSEVGVPSVVQIRVPNNTSVERSLYVVNTNPRNFSTVPTLLTVPAHSELTIDIVYTPTTVGCVQESQLRLHHPDLGVWRYQCVGTGTAPAPADPTDCICEVGGTVSVSLRLVNPFEEPMALKASLEGAPFFTLAPLPREAIAPGAEAVVTLIYAPRAVGSHDAAVSLSAAAHPAAVWHFPVRGVAEWRSADAPRRLRCPARRRCEETVVLSAPGLKAADRQSATAALELERQQQYAEAVRAALQCHIVGDETDAVDDALAVELCFAPLRPFVVAVDLVVRSERGAAWRYPLLLEATRAEFDDTLTITTAPRTAAGIKFDLYNALPQSSPFTAYFTAESSRDLTVAPTRGVLRPFGNGQRGPTAATPLQIIFAPTARVPQVEGTLIVDTDQMQWTFRVIGKLEGRRVQVK